MHIIYPMFALVLLTFAVGMALGIARLLSVSRRQVSHRYYELMQDGEPPLPVLKLTRNFSNLLEVPTLFYVFGAIVIAKDLATPAIVTLAWVYVALRLLHSAIHLTYNAPRQRFLVFLASGLVLLGLWGWLVVSLTP